MRGEAGRTPASPLFHEEQRLGLPSLRLGLRLTVEVAERVLSLRLEGLPGRLDERLSREVPLGEIARCERREGLVIAPSGFPRISRGAPGSARPGAFYSLTSNRGVVLELVNGRRLVVGSRRPEELERAVLDGMAWAGGSAE